MLCVCLHAYIYNPISTYLSIGPPRSFLKQAKGLCKGREQQQQQQTNLWIEWLWVFMWATGVDIKFTFRPMFPFWINFPNRNNDDDNNYSIIIIIIIISIALVLLVSVQTEPKPAISLLPCIFIYSAIFWRNLFILQIKLHPNGKTRRRSCTDQAEELKISRVHAEKLNVKWRPPHRTKKN